MLMNDAYIVLQISGKVHQKLFVLCKIRVFNKDHNHKKKIHKRSQDSISLV